MLGPTALALDSLPFIDDLAESINEQVIFPLLPASASLAEAIDKLQLPGPVERFLLAAYPNVGGINEENTINDSVACFNILALDGWLP